jgi:hypothetical protein
MYAPVRRAVLAPQWEQPLTAALVYLNRRLNMLPVYVVGCALVCLQLAARLRRQDAFL